MISFKNMPEEQLDEVLNRQQRIKVGQRMRRMAKRIAIKRRISMKKRASPEKLLKRARKAARNKLAKKFIKGRDMNKLSFADKERLELKLQKKKGAITKIAKRLLPKIRAAEKQRLANFRKSTGGASKLRKDSFDFHDFCCDMLYDHKIEEATYQGKKVKLNDPIRTSENPNKKFKVYVKNAEGNVVVVRFGDPKMSIKRDDPERRKNFRSRHGCDNPGPKWKAKYWSCYQWRAGAKVDN